MTLTNLVMSLDRYSNRKFMGDIPKLEYDEKSISTIDFERVPIFNEF